ncbi:hypothetical protein SAMN00777080_1076 [Aquiflexum balticum DSM 16537]|uniref:Restriction endonuclease n=1 Tax=Aquiflexum balticum DSM 16537 TaxID=758820 RepID=A0A1W2H1M6_9BACT|nr:hypothetical protein [Aquiflexum balticum]SMD42522.1 hypothetical protein SAMN00777080_1076 [Aquiflexum balticum DSM 16537]
MSDQEDIFRKFAEAEKRAGENVNPNDLLTKQEIHEFGIDIIYKYSQQEGYEIVDGTTDLNLNPQLVLKKNGQLYFVMVKTGPADGTHLTYDKDLALQVFNNAKPHNAKVLFAGVGLRCVGYGLALVRNKGFQVDFRGFEDVELVSLKPEELLAFDNYKRIKWNLDENQKPKNEVVERVKRWVAENENSIIVKKLRNKEVINIPDLNVNLDYQTVTDLMTLFPNQIFDEK